MFKWNKLGQIFNPTKLKDKSWMEEQAQNPFVLDMEDFIRVYFNTRSKKDKEGKSKSLPGFIDLSKENFINVLRISENPVIDFGELGSFDEFGVMAGSAIKIRDEYYLYYCGWSRKYSVPYDWAIGLAKSNDGITFKRFNKGPIIGATYNEPYLHAGCSCIIQENNLYHLWYTSGIKWVKTEDKPESVYQISHATSTDAINWKRNGIPIIKTVLENEAQASPTIIKLDNRWHMFFSYRHTINFRNKERGYRLGYAYSDDLVTWIRDDSQVGIDISKSGWDSEMICYPHVCIVNEKVLMFYCGNDFGREGFGVAELIR